MRSPDEAPEFEVAQWFNAPDGLRLAALRGKVVVVYAFQMLCPGCVVNATPLAKNLHETFDAELTMVGLHTVFEHHDAMTPVSLATYLHEFQIRFPVGVDQHREGDPMPITMSRYQMRGTPTFLLIDQTGRVRRHFFGVPDELVIGAEIGMLLAEARRPGGGEIE